MLGVRPDFASEGVILGVSGPLKYTHTQPFNGITRVGWYQKKYSCPFKYITLYKQQTPRQPVFTPSVNWGDLGSHLLHGSLRPPERKNQTHLNRCSRFCRAYSNSQTDRATSVARGRIFAFSACHAVRPKNY